MANFSFNKNEKIKSKKEISRLFTNGKFLFTSNFKCTLIFEESDSNFRLKMAISVPKKKIKLAVNRNLIKRRTREAFRKNKHILIAKIPENMQISKMLIYNSSKILSYQEIEKNVIECFDKISEKVLK